MVVRVSIRAVRLVVAVAAPIAACLVGMPAASATVPPPAVTTVTASTGGIHGGTHTVLDGRNFTGTTKVLFGTAPATRVQLLAPYKLSVYSPAHAAGAVHITVVTTHGTSTKVLADEFRYIPPPTVKTVTNMRAGQRASVTGGPFVKVSRVTISGQAVPFTLVNAGLLTVTVPPMPSTTPASVPVQVTDPYGLSPNYPAVVDYPSRLGVAASSVAWNDVKLSMWGNSDPNSRPLTWNSIQIERTFYPTSGATSSTTVLADLPPTTTSYDDPSVQPNSAYQYVAIPMLNGVKETPYSPVSVKTPVAPPPDTTPPPPVTGLALTANPANQTPGISLTWTDPSSTDYTGVIIRRTTGTTPPQSPTDGIAVADVAAPQASAYDPAVQGGTTYSYALFSHDTVGNDAAPVTATVTTPVPDSTPPANASGVTATPVENGITVSWTDPADADFAKVVIQRSVEIVATPNSSSWVQNTTVATIDGRATTTFTDTSAVAGVSYTYQVFAYDQAGNYRTDAPQVSAIAGCVGDPVRHVSGTLASGLVIQWSPQCAGTYVIDAPGLTVPYPTTLTVAPGTVVKASPGSALSVVGAMNAVGTSAAPITFTSTRDSSIGAAIDPGNPAAGDWAGISVGTTWDPYAHTGPFSALDLEYANVDYGTSPITGLNSYTTVAHSSIAHGINEGIAVTFSWEPPVIEDDTITDTATKSGQGALYIYDNIDPNMIGGVSGTGNGLNATVLSGGITTRQDDPMAPVLTSSSSWPIIIGHDAPGGTVTGDSFGGSTFTIAAGSVIKIAASGALDGRTIVSVGTAQAPITITSINDNTIGGVTGSGSPQPDDWEMISVGAGSLNIPTNTVFDHTAIKYSGYGINVGYGGITVTNSTISHTYSTAINVVQDATDGVPTIENNVINDSALTPDDNPALPASAAISVQSYNIDFGRIYGNTGTGDGHPGTYVSGAASGTVQADPAWPLVIGTDLRCMRTDTTQCTGHQSLETAGQLTIQPGAWVEFMYRSVLIVDGQLTAQGTSSAPIVFTSVNDSSAGTPPTTMSPAAGDWSGLQISGSATISYATFKYATHALDFSGPADKDSVQNSWFDNNTVALYSGSFASLPSSTCTAPAPYTATLNTYGDNHSISPVVTSSDYTTIHNALAQGASDAPTGWTNNLTAGTTDLIQWSTFTCPGAAHPTLATPWQTNVVPLPTLP